MPQTYAIHVSPVAVSNFEMRGAVEGSDGALARIWRHRLFVTSKIYYTSAFVHTCVCMRVRVCVCVCVCVCVYMRARAI